jgi:quinol monooxygenase YgiN
MFEVAARLKIRDGELDGFKQQAAEVMRLAQDSPAKPFRYDWFVSDDGTLCEVREAYADADGVLQHQRHVAEAKVKLLHGFVVDHQMSFYGDPSPTLAQAMTVMGITYRQFSFFQGLNDEARGIDAIKSMFEVVARLKIRDGELDGFKRQAAEVLRVAKEKDAKTLRYDWFLSDDETQCEVREGYLDPDGLLEHSDHVWEARAKLFHEFAYDHDMTIYGEPSEALTATFEEMGDAVTFTQFWLFQGLGVDTTVIEEVPAYTALMS